LGRRFALGLFEVELVVGLDVVQEDLGFVGEPGADRTGQRDEQADEHDDADEGDEVGHARSPSLNRRFVGARRVGRNFGDAGGLP